MRSVRLRAGALDSNDNLDGWVITSEMAVADGAEDIELRRGDRIALNGDVWRQGRIIANIA